MRKKISLFSLLFLVLTLLTQAVALTTVKAEDTGGFAKTSSSIHVNPNNFLDYFNLNGSATYDGSGILTLTPDARNQSGNATLKTRIDMSQSFTLEGEINLGDKSQLQGGADGIGFGFHSQTTGLLGDGGGTMGIGSLRGGFGWKADTHFNQNAQKNLAKDPSAFGNGQAKGRAFGSFMYNDDTTGTIVTHSEDIGAQGIAEPSSNAFRSINLSYNGLSKVMTVSYEGKSWTKNISQWMLNDSLSFLVSASTGSKTNLQQFRIKSFDYTPVGEIVTKYVDKFTDSEIVPGELLIGELGTTAGPLKNLEPSVLGLGYTYDSTAASDSAYYDQTIDTGTYSSNQLKVTYYYTKGQIQIHKIDESTMEALSGAEFDIYDANGNIIDHVIVDESGFGLSKVLPDGSYTLKETKAPIGYELSTHSYQATLNYGEEGKTIVELTITNKKFSETVNINGTKTWEDENDKDKIRPNSIKVNLFADDERIENREVTAESDWKYSFENLPKYNTSGEEIVYTVTEDKVEGYQTAIEGFDITNTHHAKAVDPVKPTKPSTSGNNNPNINVHDTINTNPSNETETNLPRTGDKSSVWWVTLGIFIALVTLGFYILKIKNSPK